MVVVKLVAEIGVYVCARASAHTFLDTVTRTAVLLLNTPHNRDNDALIAHVWDSGAAGNVRARVHAHCSQRARVR
jgi:hypothetical protein